MLPCHSTELAPLTPSHELESIVKVEDLNLQADSDESVDSLVRPGHKEPSQYQPDDVERV